MADFLEFARYAAAVALLLAAVAAAGRSVNRHYDRQREQ